MQYDEIIMKVIEGKLVPMIDWTNDQLDKDPDVTRNTDRRKKCLHKFMLDIREQFRDFLASPDDDERDNQDDSIFSDDDIVVGPGRHTATGFMDPPEEGDFDDDDDDDEDNPFGGFDTGNDYDDGFPK